MISVLCFILLPVFYQLHHKSAVMLLQTILGIALVASCRHSQTTGQGFISAVKDIVMTHPFTTIILIIAIATPLKYLQRKLRFLRLNTIKMKYGYTNNPESWENMTIEEAQEIERNMAEWEFPHLWQFGWISDFLRASKPSPFLCSSTDPRLDFH